MTLDGVSKLDEHLRTQLAALDAQGLLRRHPEIPADALVLCSNDYLGYADLPLEGLESAGGAGASRLISGGRDAHRNAERAIADWMGTEAALLFTSGYAANVGALAALAEEGDVIVSDQLNHASLIDGCRLSRARVQVVPHGDLDAVEAALIGAEDARRRFVVTETYFSMDGDNPDLRALRRLADAHDAALFVDEAHALGVFGPEGAGMCRDRRVTPDVLVGTLGKALGLAGAFVAGPRSLCDWLFNRARSFVFSTATPPVLANAVERRVQRVRTDDARRARLWTLVGEARARLRKIGAPVAPTSTGPIIPWVIGDSRRVIELRDALLNRGIFVQAIRPPTVPAGTDRLRITLHATLTDDQLSLALDAFAALVD